MKKLMIPLAYISLFWGVVINAAVALNLKFALPLAAGGQYDNFPASLRIAYFFQMLWILYEIRVLSRLTEGRAVRPRWIVNVFIVLSLIGFVLNIFSTSPPERWNAAGLAITAYAFVKLKPANS